MTPAKRAGRSVALGVAVLRVTILPVVIVGEDALSYSDETSTAFAAALGAAAAWGVGMLLVRAHLWRTGRDGPAWLGRVEPATDLLLLGALVYASGGAYSSARKAVFVVPFAAAVRTLPRQTALWSIGAMLTFAVASFLHPSADDEDFEGVFLAHIVYLAWASLFAVFLAAMLSRRSAREAGLAEDRGHLATQALLAEERERRRLAELLHDEVVQNVLAARQEVATWRRHGRADAADRVEAALEETVRQLRGEIFDLHPYVADHAGLAAAARAMAERAERRTDSAIRVDVAPAAEGLHDGLVIWLIRELLNNAIKHAQAPHVDVSVSVDDGTLTVSVRDDGVGFAIEDAERAVASGHIGLAAARQRVQAARGVFAIRSAPGAGTEVVATLPA